MNLFNALSKSLHFLNLSSELSHIEVATATTEVASGQEREREKNAAYIQCTRLQKKMKKKTLTLKKAEREELFRLRQCSVLFEDSTSNEKD